MTLYPLLNQLSSPDGYFADINTNPGNTDTSTWATKDGSGYNSTKTGDNNTILNVSPIAGSNTTNSSNPVQQVTWELISGSMKTEDVSSFFVGKQGMCVGCVLEPIYLLPHRSLIVLGDGSMCCIRFV